MAILCLILVCFVFRPIISISFMQNPFFYPSSEGHLFLLPFNRTRHLEDSYQWSNQQTKFRNAICPRLTISPNLHHMLDDTSAWLPIQKPAIYEINKIIGLPRTFGLEPFEHNEPTCPIGKDYSKLSGIDSTTTKTAASFQEFDIASVFDGLISHIFISFSCVVFSHVAYHWVRERVDRARRAE